MTQIDLQEAQEQFMKLIELAASGEEIVISKNKRPFVKLLPISNPIRQREFGSAKGLIKMADDFDESLADFEEYM
jgi:prevent-host-death family protein